MKSWRMALVVVGLANALLAESANATFHFMQIQQVIGGVDGNTDAQAIQLRMLSGGQNLLAGQARLVAYDAAGSNPVVITTFPSPNPSGGQCREILIASSAFADVTNPPVDSAAADYQMDNLIPASYLAAGSLTFETANGVIVYWRLSWGGASYTGPTTGSFDNDSNGNFGPPFAGPLPSSTSQALTYVNACPPGTSTSNNVDYALTNVASLFTNNAGSRFLVCTECPAVSSWGLTVMALMILTAGTLEVSRRMIRSRGLATAACPVAEE